jgi:hypothetical protein
MFWGEQPPFMSIGHGGRYFFGTLALMDEPDRTKRQPRSAWPIAFVLIALIAAALAALIFFRIENWPAHTVRDLRAAFIDVAHLQPKITIRNRVYLEQTAPTAELATVVRKTEIAHEFLHTWAGSTKRIQLRGVFFVKAGFDLHKNFSVDVRENEIDVRLPRAQILGVEEQKVDVLAYENGFWNRISAEDIESELQSLPQLAREKAAQANLTAEAERTLKEQLEQKIKARQPVRVRFESLALPPPSATR